MWNRLSITMLLVAFFPKMGATEKHPLSLSQAVQLALKHNQEISLADAKWSEAEAKRKSIRGLYGPKLLLEGNLMYWDSALPFSFNPPSELPASLKPFEPLLKDMDKLFDLGNIRDQLTGQLSVTLAQPLTPLLQIHNAYKATQFLSQAAQIGKENKKQEVAHKVSKQFFQLLQAERMAQVAKTGVDQVEAHLKRAKHFLAAELIGKQQVLKAQLELARAKQRLIQAKTGLALGRSALALLLGFDVHSVVVPKKPPTDAYLSPKHSEKLLIRKALKTRVELQSMGHQLKAADANRRRSKWQMIPDLSAVASYQYTRGQGTFFPENAFFVGGILKWSVWSWGNTYYGMKATAEKTRQATIGMQLLRDGIVLQVKKAYLEQQMSLQNLKVAKAAIKEAEENFRIETSRFNANANKTTTDVLDAQLALTRAKLSHAAAMYAYHIAKVSLAWATGSILK